MDKINGVVGRLLPGILTALVAAGVATAGAHITFGNYQEKISHVERDVAQIQNVDLPEFRNRVSKIEATLSAISASLDAHNKMNDKYQKDLDRLFALLTELDKELARIKK